MSIRTLPGLQEITRQGQRSRMRGRHTVIDADSFEAECDAVDLDEVFSFHDSPATKTAARRASDGQIIKGDAVRALDELLERHGLAAIVATLRSLADSRTDNGCGEGEDFATLLDTEESSKGWRTAADALETLVTSGKVDAR